MSPFSECQAGNKEGYQEADRWNGVDGNVALCSLYNVCSVENVLV